MINRAGFGGLLLLLLFVAPAVAQENEEPEPQRAAALIRDAIAARGGDTYLKIQSLVSTGRYTPFLKGVSSLPESFADYIVYPDRERTEFRKGKYIQTNVAGSGWIFDSEQKMIRDQTEEQVSRWRQGMRYDLDNLLRGGAKEPGVKLTYLGRREAWKNTFSEAIRIEFADRASVVLHFDSRTKLPMMSEFKTVGEEGPVDEQIRYYQWLDFNGVMFPKIQDVYRKGVQSSRIYFETVEFNVKIQEKLFAKPANIKEVK